MVTIDATIPGRLSEKVSEIIDLLAEWYDFQRDDPNLKGTPERVTKAYLELLAGYDIIPDAIHDLLATDFPAGKYDEMIVCKDIEFSSLCIHHMMPFTGKIAVGYIPNNGRVIGLSKIPRVCQAYARRLQIQEQLTQQVATAIMEHVKPKGVGVVISDCVHTCASMRGINQHGMNVTTSALLGEFLDDASVRREFLSLIGR